MPKIRKRVKEVSKIACIYDFIESKKDGFFHNAGELGKTMSGGQKQRIGIARALYYQKDFLILDEATSALDPKTEEKVLKNIIKYLPKKLTVIIVSHNYSSLSFCNQIYEIMNGEISLINYDLNNK